MTSQVTNALSPRVSHLWEEDGVKDKWKGRVREGGNEENGELSKVIEK
jgi:hypothetical protein